MVRVGGGWATLDYFLQRHGGPGETAMTCQILASDLLPMDTRPMAGGITPRGRRLSQSSIFSSEMVLNGSRTMSPSVAGGCGPVSGSTLAMGRLTPASSIISSSGISTSTGGGGGGSRSGRAICIIKRASPPSKAETDKESAQNGTGGQTNEPERATGAGERCLTSPSSSGASSVTSSVGGSGGTEPVEHATQKLAKNNGTTPPVSRIRKPSLGSAPVTGSNLRRCTSSTTPLSRRSSASSPEPWMSSVSSGYSSHSSHASHQSRIAVLQKRTPPTGNGSLSASGPHFGSNRTVAGMTATPTTTTIGSANKSRLPRPRWNI